MRKTWILFLFISICCIGLGIYDAIALRRTQKFLHLVALGDSITVGQRNCQHFDCEFEPNTYTYLFAKSLRKKGIIDYANYGYSGSTAACGYVCKNNDIVETSATSFPNAYVKKVVQLPYNQSSIEKTDNLVNQTAPGVVRTKLGEFNSISHSIVTIAWGRNDEDSPEISVDAFRKALVTIASHIEKDPTNKIIFLTIPPINWLSWNSFLDRRHEFDDRIANQANPVELDAFFSAMIWEAAYATHASVAPVSEYVWFHPHSMYLAADNIHPSSLGHAIIADILEKDTGDVFKLPVSIASGSAFSIHAKTPTYGQIVWEKGTVFFYSQPFYADQEKPFTTVAKTALTTIYANGNVSVE